MTVAGFEIIACPACNALFRKLIILSYNTFFAGFYSDGYMDGRTQAFVLCKPGTHPGNFLILSVMVERYPVLLFPENFT